MNAFWRALSKNRLALGGGAVVLTLAVMAVAAPLVAPHDPHKPDTKRILEAPSSRHWLGTDQVGRDVLSRMLYGARVSLAVGFVSVGIATAIGIVLGSAAGYHGGTVDAAVMRLVDLAEYKRRQYPPGPKITPKAFGRDRRLPITNRWRDLPHAD